jgi:hypothetical protein
MIQGIEGSVSLPASHATVVTPANRLISLGLLDSRGLGSTGPTKMIQNKPWFSSDCIKSLYPRPGLG